jgi:hypothetical protein
VHDVVEPAMAKANTFDKRRVTDAFWLGDTEVQGVVAWASQRAEHYDQMDERAALPRRP